MKFVLLTNTYNLHTKPIADELFKLLGEDFCFICRDIVKAKDQLGWNESSAPYLLNMSEKDKEDKCKTLIRDADIVYFGANPYMFSDIEERIAMRKPILYHSERLFKRGFFQFFIPNYTKRYINQRIKPSRYSESFVLACSAFLPYDYKRMGACTDRIFRFGYFPKYREQDILPIIEKRQDKPITILCVGRLLKLKHFDDVIKAFAGLSHGIKAELKIIGSGEDEVRLKKLAKEKQNSNHITFLGEMSADKVREEMEHSDIFIISSNKREGWGAVLNEAMNSGCACIAADMVGSGRYLIEPEINGLLYKSGSIADLKAKLQMLCERDDYRKKLGIAAYKTISEEWNPQIAAQRLVQFSDAILKNESICFESGPLSKAPIIKG